MHRKLHEVNHSNENLKMSDDLGGMAYLTKWVLKAVRIEVLWSGWTDLNSLWTSNFEKMLKPWSLYVTSIMLVLCAAHV